MSLSQHWCIFSAALIFLLTASTPASAGLGQQATPAQLADDIRVLLKQVHAAESAYFAGTGEYSAEAAKIGLTVPRFLTPYGELQLSTQVTSTGPSFTAIFAGTQAPVAGAKFSVGTSGALKGVAQYATAAELVSELRQTLRAAHVAEAAYYTEFGNYTADLERAGFEMPPYLSRWVSLGIRVASDGQAFRVTLKGLAYPVLDWVMTVDQTGELSGL